MRMVLTSLEKAMASVHEVLALEKTVIVRDATIQRFEYTYELCVTLLKRHLEQEAGVTDVDQLDKRDLFRVANEKGLIRDTEAWFGYYRARNQTSHTYNSRKAEQVYEAVRPFAADAQFLLDELKKRQGD